MKNNKVIYALTIDDIQTVANETIDRDLSPEEIKKMIAPIAEKINWFDAIKDSIKAVIK